jgi:hypothetical protein
VGDAFDVVAERVSSTNVVSVPELVGLDEEPEAAALLVTNDAGPVLVNGAWKAAYSTFPTNSVRLE